MQPFPTAFWKSTSVIEELEEDSCFSIENAFLIGEDTDGNSEYFLGEVINTDANPYLLTHEYSTANSFKPGIYIDAIASDASVGAGTAFTFSSTGSDEDFYNPKLYTKNFDDLINGDPLSDNGGVVTRYSNPSINNLKERFGGLFIHLPNSTLYAKYDIQAILSDWPIFMLNRFKIQAPSIFQVRKLNSRTKILTVGEWKASSILPTKPISDTSDCSICEPVLALTDLSASKVGCCGKEGNFKHGHRAMQKHFSYVWMKKSGLHKTHPVTVTLSEDCKTVRTKCYFEKDLLQKFSEISIKKDQTSLSLLSSKAKEYIEEVLTLDPYGTFDNEIVRELIQHGYNGNYWGEDAPGSSNDASSYASAQLNYLYRQSAKVDIGINFSEAKNIVVKVRGLGSDDHGSLYEDDFGIGEKNLQKFQRKFAIDEIDALSSIIGDANVPDDIMGRVDDSYYAYGDRQTCMIVINSQPEIFATAPNAGVYQRDSNYTLNEIEFSNFAKGPVRVFQRIANFTAAQRRAHSKSSNEIEAGSDLLGYRFTGGGGDLDLPGISRVGGGTNDRRNIIDTSDNGTYQFRKRDSGNFHPGYGLEYIHKLDGTPYVPDSFANYYGTLYKPSHAYFYDYDSINSGNLNTPPYYSPYTYQQTFELPAGESKIEIIFDSVFNFLNGGAYYDIEVSYT